MEQPQTRQDKPEKQDRRHNRYKLGDVYEKEGQRRRVVGIIGEFVEMPAIIIVDVKGRHYDVAPQLTTAVVQNIEKLMELQETNSGGWEMVDKLALAVSNACTPDNPKLTPEFLKENFHIQTMISFSQEILQAAMEQAGRVKATYESDPATKNE